MLGDSSLKEIHSAYYLRRISVHLMETRRSYAVKCGGVVAEMEPLFCRPVNARP